MMQVVVGKTYHVCDEFVEITHCEADVDLEELIYIGTLNGEEHCWFANGEPCFCPPVGYNQFTLQELEQ